MRDLMVPVMAGLAVGIAVIVLFSLTFKSPSSLTDTELIEKAKTSKQVQFFLQKYPEAKIAVDRLERGTEVSFLAEKQVTNLDASQDGVSEKRLTASVDPTGGDGIALRLECYHAGGGMIASYGVTVDDIDRSCF
jgi:hypothetical protein